MYVELSQQSQEYIAEQLAQGKFSSEAELLEAAVHQLRLTDWMDAFCDENETEILKN
jgi:Arc/MetJ-type ribon-helix-helix transcriptional regulator